MAAYGFFQASGLIFGVLMGSLHPASVSMQCSILLLSVPDVHSKGFRPTIFLHNATGQQPDMHCSLISHETYAALSCSCPRKA